VAAPTTPRPGRAIALIALAVIALYAWMFISGNTSPKLGIDLRGGTSLTLKPVVPKGDPTTTITDDAVNQAVQIIRDRVDGQGVAEASVTKQGSGAGSTIVVEVPGKNEQDLYDKIGKTAKLGFRPLLLSAGGPQTCVNQVAATPSPSATASGTASPSASTTTSPSPSASPSASGNGRPATGLKAASGSPTASPTATPTASGTPSATPSPTQSCDLTGTAGTGYTAAEDQALNTLDCTGTISEADRPADIATKNLITCASDGTEKYILGPELVQGTDITDANAGLQTSSTGITTGDWVVNLSFNSDGTKKFAVATRTMFAATNGSDANRFAIVLDSQVISAPTVQGVIQNGQPQISGSFTQQSATDLANQLKYGKLPLAFAQLNLGTISPTLGSDQLRAGILAGALGLVLVVVYSLFYYRGLGLVTVASLMMAGLLTFGLLVLLGQTMGYTLSLAGIAGAIVSIGITADSFVVLFERVRDEMRDGRTLRVAVESGWKRAQRTILAADAVSLIAAVALYFLSVSQVQGFAFTLGLTTLIDVIVVFLFTKPMLTRLARTKFFGEGTRWSGLNNERLGIKRPVPPATRRTKEA
jgi:preprotein translocase subunit SecD